MKEKMKKPAGLKTRPAWLLQDHMARARQSAVATRVLRRGVCGYANLKVADGDHLIPPSNSDGEGAGAAAQDHIEAVVERLKGWNQAPPSMDPDKGGGEQLGWQLAEQIGARIVPRQRGRNMQGCGKMFDNSGN